MKFCDISLRKRLLFGNFLMIFIPVCVMAAMAWLIFVGIRFVDSDSKSELISNLFEDKGSALSVQFAVSSIKNIVENGDELKLKKLKNACRILESQGISVIISRDEKILYATHNSNITEIDRLAERKISSPSMMLWDDNGFIFRYTSKKHGAIVTAVGKIPFDEQKSVSELPIKKILEVIGVTILIFAVIFIVVLGRYLSRLLSRQILEPLQNLREVSEQFVSAT